MGIFVEGRLAQLGHKIIPLFGARDGRCECRRSSCDAPGKHSPIKWKDAATTDLDTISAWLRQWSNYGVVTERIFAIDIDVRHGGDQTWRSLTTGINIS